MTRTNEEVEDVTAPVTPPPTGQRRRGRSRRLGSGWVVVIATAPGAILLGLFFIFPIIQAIRISLSEWEGVGPIDFSGIEQYTAVLTSPDFYRSLGVTLEYSISSAFVIVAIATVLAAAVSQRVKGARFYRVVWFIPGIAPAAAVAVYWNLAFQPGDGSFNALLGFFGLNNQTALLASTSTAIYPLIFVTIWAGVGFAFILILGGVEAIPTSVYEAAKIDGASASRQFFSITLPLVRPVLAITATLNLIWAFNNFSTVYGLTRGGPGSATTTLPIKVYLDAFSSGQYGQATSVAILAGIILMALGFVSLRLSQARNGD